MICDPLQKSTLVCPDTFCPNTNITFAVCEYTIAKDTNNQTAFTYTGCADTSNLSCDAFKVCALFNIYVMQHGVNQTNAANGTKYAARCLSSATANNSTTASNSTPSSTAIAGGASASIGNTYQTLCTSILLLICLLTISMSKRLF
ncbi:hypothetical protein INT46_004251 [Mucor plumbeus]|uniref:Uncharacterized protein n=1 Tax=Mucor plumbeus TaxID=97098 RepID=A0A8H7US57_9FUNG|nr:hypothetical protein INT46_004251 [Mucor plumbeus]